MKLKGNNSKWASFVAPETTNNVALAVVNAINSALQAAGLNVTRVSLIQAGNAIGADEEIGLHDALQDPTFDKNKAMNYYGDFQEASYEQFNYGLAVNSLRSMVGQSATVSSVALQWLVQQYQRIAVPPAGQPGATWSLSPGNPYQVILNANPAAIKVIEDRVTPLLEAALDADGGL